MASLLSENDEFEEQKSSLFSKEYEKVDENKDLIIERLKRQVEEQAKRGNRFHINTQRTQRFHTTRVEQSEWQKFHRIGLNSQSAKRFRTTGFEQSECHKVSHQRGDQHRTRDHPAPETNTPRGHPCLTDQCQRPFISRD